MCSKGIIRVIGHGAKCKILDFLTLLPRRRFSFILLFQVEIITLGEYSTVTQYFLILNLFYYSIVAKCGNLTNNHIIDYRLYLFISRGRIFTDKLQDQDSSGTSSSLILQGHSCPDFDLFLAKISFFQFDKFS